MKTLAINAYSFSELKGEAKRRAMEWINEFIFSRSSWYDSVINDAKTVGGILGLNIEAIYWDQDLRITLEGRYSYAKGWKKALKAYAPIDKDLPIIGQELQNIQKKCNWVYSATISQSWKNSISIESNYPESDGSLASVIKSFCQWASHNLQNEANYLESEEYMKDMADANDWLFDEKGRIL